MLLKAFDEKTNASHKLKIYLLYYVAWALGSNPATSARGLLPCCLQVNKRVPKCLFSKPSQVSKCVLTSFERAGEIWLTRIMRNSVFI